VLVWLDSRIALTLQNHVSMRGFVGWAHQGRSDITAHGLKTRVTKESRAPMN
jgi:hypothetical protein